MWNKVDITTPSAPCPVTDIMRKSSFQNFITRGQEPGFEGAEKRLEIDLKYHPTNSMRNASREFWDEVMRYIHASIKDTLSNDFFDAYVLTESSLFVHPHRITLITCGTTRLLNSLAVLVRGIEDQGLEIEWVSYSRKDFMYPWEQPSPHASVSEEYEALAKYFPNGNLHILGPLNRDHYVVFIMDLIDRPKQEIDQQLNIVMYDVDETVAKKFFNEESSVNSDQTTKIRDHTGLTEVLGGFATSDMAFAPCGYSINATKQDYYYTFHVTPESHCSFASFETIQKLPSYKDVVEQILNVFKPQRFAMMMLLDENSEANQQKQKGNDVGLSSYSNYDRVNFTLNEFEPRYCTYNATFVRRDTPGTPREAGMS